MMSPGITYIDVISSLVRTRYNDESVSKENLKFQSFESLAIKVVSVDSNLIMSNTGLIIWPEIWIWFESFFDEFKHPAKNKSAIINEK